jgi:hypothetical protein
LHSSAGSARLAATEQPRHKDDGMARNGWKLAMAALLLGIAAPAAAADRWTAIAADATAYPPEIVAETRAAAPGGMPNGLVARHDGPGDIVAAWYAVPTGRYGHGVLGDAVEAGRLVVRSAAGKTLEFTLPKNEVFEDRYPRLADLDGDGTVEVVAIRTSVRFGASVAV